MVPYSFLLIVNETSMLGHGITCPAMRPSSHGYPDGMLFGKFDLTFAVDLLEFVFHREYDRRYGKFGRGSKLIGGSFRLRAMPGMCCACSLRLLIIGYVLRFANERGTSWRPRRLCLECCVRGEFTSQRMAVVTGGCAAVQGDFVAFSCAALIAGSDYTACRSVVSALSRML